MDIWHKLGKYFRASNLGTLIFFLLNIGLILLLISPNGLTAKTVLAVIAIYAVTVALSLSPLGEWVLVLLSGARRIKRREIIIRLLPLLEVVLEKANENSLPLIGTVNLKIVEDDNPNAFALGRKTICVTQGLMKLSDEEIMAVFAHEVGHLANKHSTIQLLFGGGNLFISGCLLIIKLVCWMISGIFAMLAICTRRLFWGTLIALVGSISSVLIWLWTKFCLLFLRWSMRQNEYVADEFAYRIGFGEELAYVLDRCLCEEPQKGLFGALWATHPRNTDRVAHLQELGVAYMYF